MTDRSERAQQAMQEALADAPLPPLQSQPRPVGEGRPRATAPYSRRKKPEANPWGLIFCGVLLAFLGGIALAVQTGVMVFLGFVLIGLGGVVSSIGIIAEGVRIGASWVVYDRGE